MSSFTLHQCWIIIGIIAVVLLSFVCRYPAPAVWDKGSSPSALPAFKRNPFVVEIVGGVVMPGVYSFPRAVTVAEVIEEAGGLEDKVSVSPEHMPVVVRNGSVLSIGRHGVCSGETLMDAHKRFLFFVPFAINRAGAEELMLVPGIGERTARAIVSYRDQHGCFPRLETLLKVPGIGPRNFARMRDFLVL